MYGLFLVLVKSLFVCLYLQTACSSLCSYHSGLCADLIGLLLNWLGEETSPFSTGMGMQSAFHLGQLALEMSFGSITVAMEIGLFAQE